MLGELPDNYRFKVQEFFSLPHLKLQKRTMKFFWTTVDAIIPVPPPDDPYQTVEELFEWATAELWMRELQRNARKRELEALRKVI